MFTEINPHASEPGGSRPPRRGPGRPRGATPQSAAMRNKLYAVAVRLFAAQGFEQTTLREIAAAAEVSPALLYRYFPSKRAVVLALYDELSQAFAARAASLPPGRWRERFLFALDASLDVLGPHRGTLVALVPVLVGGREDNLFAPATAFSRDRVRSRFVAAVTEADDAPRGTDAAALGRVLYLTHLSILLWWLLDRSEDQQSTRRLRGVVARGLTPFALALKIPGAKALLRDLDDLAQRGLFGAAPGDAA